MFGNTQVFSSTTTVADRRAMPYTMPEKGNIQSICIYHEGGTGNLLLAVYNDNGSGKPGTRLGAGWQTVELTSPVDVAEGQTIWLAWVFSNNPGIRYTTGSPGRAASGVGWSGGMPGSFGSSTTSSYIYSIYANYTSTGLIGNPYMFTGRRFDIETGLYYYRARYYNPHIGRFMQTDPIGYGDGINWYVFCGNNPIGRVDPYGLYFTFLDWWYTEKNKLGKKEQLVFAWVDGGDDIEPDLSLVTVIKKFSSLGRWYKWAPGFFNDSEKNIYEEDWDKEKQVGWELSGRWESEQKLSRDSVFWRLQAMRYLSSDVGGIIGAIEGILGQSQYSLSIYANFTPKPEYNGSCSGYRFKENNIVIDWNYHGEILFGKQSPGLVALTHELSHAYDFLRDGSVVEPQSQGDAIALENRMRLAFYWKVPGSLPNIYPR